jgi:maleylacetate reductase
MSTMLAIEGLIGLCRSPAQGDRQSQRLEARGETLYGAWLCGTVLGQVGMALHHKLCHTLGGSFDLPHAETHAVVLPHAIAYNARRGSGSAGAGHRDFRRNECRSIVVRFRQIIGAPMALKGSWVKRERSRQSCRSGHQQTLLEPAPGHRPAIARSVAGRLGRRTAGYA